MFINNIYKYLKKFEKKTTSMMIRETFPFLLEQEIDNFKIFDYLVLNRNKWRKMIHISDFCFDSMLIKKFKSKILFLKKKGKDNI